jgi:hypothetical protein
MHFTRANWDVLATDPESHKGATVDIVGRVWSAPERDDEGTLHFMMLVDPKNSEWETLVSFPDSSTRIASDDYVRVKGTVHVAYTGESAEVPSSLPTRSARSTRLPIPSSRGTRTQSSDRDD